MPGLRLIRSAIVRSAVELLDEPEQTASMQISFGVGSAQKRVFMLYYKVPHACLTCVTQPEILFLDVTSFEMYVTWATNGIILLVGLYSQSAA